MRLYLTRHVLERMAERVFSEAEIEHVLNNPGLSYPTPQGSIQYEGTFPDGRTLKVWVVAVEDQNGTVVPKLDSIGRLIVKSAAWKGE